MDCEEALLRLKAGNERFVSGEFIHPHEEKDLRRRLRLAQRPIAAVLGCSDSQAPPEIVFDQGLGDLFVIRVAGNVIAPGTLGSIQYAGTYLGVRLFVVLGHEGCDAIKAALLERQLHVPQPGQIEVLTRLILPALNDVKADANLNDQMDAAVKANVRWSVTQIREMPLARRPVQEGQVKIIGAVCDLESGRVRFLD